MLDAVGSKDAVVLDSVRGEPRRVVVHGHAHLRLESAHSCSSTASRACSLTTTIRRACPPMTIEAMLDDTNPSARRRPSTSVAQWAPSAAERSASSGRWWHETGRRGASPATARALLRVARRSGRASRAARRFRVPVLVAYLRRRCPKRSGSRDTWPTTSAGATVSRGGGGRQLLVGIATARDRDARRDRGVPHRHAGNPLRLPHLA